MRAILRLDCLCLSKCQDTVSIRQDWFTDPPGQDRSQEAMSAKADRLRAGYERERSGARSSGHSFHVLSCPKHVADLGRKLQHVMFRARRGAAGRGQSLSRMTKTYWRVVSKSDTDPLVEFRVGPTRLENPKRNGSRTTGTKIVLMSTLFRFRPDESGYIGRQPYIHSGDKLFGCQNLRRGQRLHCRRQTTIDPLEPLAADFLQPEHAAMMLKVSFDIQPFLAQDERCGLNPTGLEPGLKTD